MPVTSPDSQYFPDAGATWASVSDFALAASSTQNAFNNREQYTFRWNNSTERGNETTMRQGDTGYQIDTRSSYVFDNNAWRLQISYAELNSSSQSSTTVSAYVAFSTISINSGTSTDTNFVTGGSGSITLTNAGIYSFSVYATSTSFISAGNNSYVQISDASNPGTAANQLAREYWSPGASTVTLAMPFYYAAAAGQTIYFWYFFTSGTSPSTVPGLVSKIRVGRLA